MPELPIDRADVVRLDVSKCVEISRLNDGDVIRDLREQAHAGKLTLGEIREIVHRVMGVRPVTCDEVVKKMGTFRSTNGPSSSRRFNMSSAAARSETSGRWS